MHIKPIHKLTREEIRTLAHEAADRGDSQAHANVFAADTEAHRQFNSDYLKREYGAVPA